MYVRDLRIMGMQLRKLRGKEGEKERKKTGRKRKFYTLRDKVSAEMHAFSNGKGRCLDS